MNTYFTKLINFIKKDKNDLILSLLVGLTIVFTCSVLNYSYIYSMNVKTDLKDNVIRFHILANSDEQYDQDLKVYVKNQILKKYKNDLIKNNTREDAITFFNDNMEEIELYAEEVIREQGYDYDVNCELKYADFPTKSYNDISLPQGEYLAFRVLIGEHKGKNFWCVLYPPLCYTDAVDTTTFNNAKTKLEENLSDDEFLLVSDQNSPLISVKFKMVEMWNNEK